MKYPVKFPKQVITCNQKIGGCDKEYVIQPLLWGRTETMVFR
jgi:hypothetical protein